MRNCLILGSGRSGTSMLSGILHQAGYFMGDKLYPGIPSNPKGFFEWREINRINELILADYIDDKSFKPWIMKNIFKKNTVVNPGKNQKWLLSLSPQVQVSDAHPDLADRIKKVAAREPFCYKDPRFSYTLPVWENFLKADTAYICVFREPAATAVSILKECRTREYLADLYITRRQVYRVWANIYSHILLKQDISPGNFFFVHYNQIYDGSALAALAKFLNADLKADFVEKDLKRSVSFKQVPRYVQEIYERLCALAYFKAV